MNESIHRRKVEFSYNSAEVVNFMHIA